jgi:hypothetical protein
MNNFNQPVVEEVQFESIGPDHELMQRKIIDTVVEKPPRPFEPRVDNVDKFGRRFRK